MHVFFEDDGQLKAGTVLADNEASLQVEAASGKRLKVKAAAVLLRFAEPSPSALQAEAQTLARELDPNFLWEVSADDEFGFADLAREYYGRAPAPPEAAAVAVALASAPMYFYKRGKGRYRKAPPDALKAALASVERKRREGEQMAAWVDELRAHRLPDALRAKLPMLLYAPDRNALEWKALAAACDSAQTNPVALLAQCGAIPSSHDYHYNGFLAQAFPKGIALPRVRRAPATAGPAARGRARVLDRRSHDDRDRRRVLGARARERPPRDRHPHRGAGARRSRAARRSTRSRASACRPSTCPGARSRCCPTPRSPRSRSRRARRGRRCRCTPRSRRTARSFDTRRG